jgi:hypothetical protein
MDTVIEIQDRYIERINVAWSRWEHRRRPGDYNNFGHFGRARRASNRQAAKDLRKLGYTDEKIIGAIIKDAWDVADLQRNTEE